MGEELFRYGLNTNSAKTASVAMALLNFLPVCYTLFLFGEKN